MPEQKLRGIVRGLSFGFLVAASVFGGALMEHGLLSAHKTSVARFLPTISQYSARRPPLRGSMDIGAPLLLPSEAPQAPRKAPARRRGSSAMQFAGVPLLDRTASAG